MSELAYDKDGEPIAPNPLCRYTRVRRFRNPGTRGTCENLRDDDGGLLYAPADCTYLEFRQLVGGEPGFYRLDQCDAHKQPLPDAEPFYVSISEDHRNAGAAGEDARDAMIRELVRANADMCRTMALQQADMMRAAADLMRAADGAGLPRREPVPREPDADDDEDDEDDLDDQADDDGKDQVPGPLWALIQQMLPMVQAWIVAQVAKRSAPPTPAAAPTPAPAPPPAGAPPRAGAAGPGASPTGGPATGATTAPPATSSGPAATRSPPARGSSPSAANSPPAGAAERAAPDIAGRPPSAAPGTAADQAAPEPGVRNAAPTAEQVAHLLAVRACLDPRETAIADAAVVRMTPELQAQWLGELSALTVDQAVDLVRSMIPPGDG